MIVAAGIVVVGVVAVGIVAVGIVIVVVDVGILPVVFAAFVVNWDICSERCFDKIYKNE